MRPASFFCLKESRYNNGMKDNSVCILLPGDTRPFEVIVEGNTINETLDNVFEGFNAGSPKEHPYFINSAMRSFSVNDLVRVDGRWFQCDPCGWSEVSAEYVDELVEMVHEEMSKGAHATAWSALDYIMTNRRAIKYDMEAMKDA